MLIRARTFIMTIAALTAALLPAVSHASSCPNAIHAYRIVAKAAPNNVATIPNTSASTAMMPGVTRYSRMLSGYVRAQSDSVRKPRTQTSRDSAASAANRRVAAKKPSRAKTNVKHDELVQTPVKLVTAPPMPSVSTLQHLQEERERLERVEQQAQEEQRLLAQVERQRAEAEIARKEEARRLQRIQLDQMEHRMLELELYQAEQERRLQLAEQAVRDASQGNTGAPGWLQNLRGASGLVNQTAAIATRQRVKETQEIMDSLRLQIDQLRRAMQY